VPRSSERDLRVLPDAQAAVKGHDVVLHLAADAGGLAYSSRHSAEQYYNCATMDLQVLEAARQAGTPRLLCVSSSTAYPERAASPLDEGMLFGELPRETHIGYGLAKRNLVALALMYHRQYGSDVATIVSSNAFGPGDDTDAATSHVIPATILKCLREPELVVWGDGAAVRDFFYVEDLAEAILLAAERLPAGEYVNVGSGREVTIRELVTAIVRLTGFGGPVRYDTSKPGGEARRTVSIEKARRAIGFEPAFSLEEGLRRTIEWCRRVTLANV
jgi:GDP-L-fucose synthase